MKKVSLAFAILGMCMFGSMQVWAAQSNDALESATAFLQEIGEDDDYALWKDADLQYGYELLGADMETPVGDLYYVEANSQNAGYMIIDNTNFSILEFSVGAPAYDMYQQETRDASTVFLYINAMPAVYGNGIYSDIDQSGEIQHSFDVTNNTLLRYDPNLQGGNCIVGAISNLMWHWSNNGYSSLASGMTFQGVESEVDALIKAEGGYANNNIPNTIKNYVKGKNSSYSASVTNKWSPTFSNVKTETASRPCLLGFAAGSDYSDKVGHMTVCIGTRTASNVNYCKLMDGHNTSVVEKQWGSYNDFMSKVTLSK